MKKLSLALFLICINFVFAQDKVRTKLENNTLSDSDINLAIEALKKTLIKLNVPLGTINNKLSDPFLVHELKTIFTEELKSNEKFKKFTDEEDVELVSTLLIGFGDSSVMGLAFKGKNYTLCLPCEVAWNSFSYGLIKNPISRNKIDPEMQCAKTLTLAKKKKNYNAFLNSLMIPYTNESNEKGIVFYQNKNDSSHVIIPKGYLSPGYKKPLKVTCNEKTFVLNFNDGAPIGQEESKEVETIDAKCKMVFNEKINENIQSYYKETLDHVYHLFLESPNKKDVFLGALKACQEIPYGNIIYTKIKEHVENEVQKIKDENGIQK